MTDTSDSLKSGALLKGGEEGNPSQAYDLPPFNAVQDHPVLYKEHLLRFD